MTEIEDRLRDAMHAAVDDAMPPPNLVAAVIRAHRRHVGLVACLAVAAVVLGAVSAAVALGQLLHCSRQTLQRLVSLPV